ncbi:hypothetical protein C8R47DRAFT_213127 [Mycena vitilis]|nr:hypothetical protein C8R47DRAFT_213127 [Mycena vitilis]
MQRFGMRSDTRVGFTSTAPSIPVRGRPRHSPSPSSRLGITFAPPRLSLFFLDHHHLSVRWSAKTLSTFSGLSIRGATGKLGVSGFWVARYSSVIRILGAPLLSVPISSPRFFVCKSRCIAALLPFPSLDFLFKACSAHFLVSISGFLFALVLLFNPSNPQDSSLQASSSL